MRSLHDLVWERGWDGHQRAQLRRLAVLTLPQKLHWLEEADALVRYLRLRRDRINDRSHDLDDAPR